MCYRFSLLLFLLKVLQVNSDSSCTLLSGEQGKCVRIGQCPVIAQAFVNPINGTQELLRKYLCGKHLDSKVCCADGWNSTVYGKALPSKQYCGYQHRDDYISTQNTTSLDEFPWLAAIKGIQASTGKEMVFCHGTLISDRYVLTAAQCLNFRESMSYKATHVLLGKYGLKTEIDCIELAGYGDECSNSVSYGIQEIIAHPFFNAEDGLNDIALLRLNQKVLYSDYIRPICLPTKNGVLAKPGDTCYITGWGRPLEIGKESPTKKKVKTTLMASDDCNKFFRGQFDISLYFNMCTLDAEDNAVFSCTDDTGVPVMFPYKNQWHIEGIVSRRAQGLCCSSYPGINTRVYSYLDWIKQNMRP